MTAVDLVATVIMGFTAGHYGCQGLMGLTVLRHLPPAFSFTAPNGDEYLAVMRPAFRRRARVYAWVMVLFLSWWIGHGVADLVGVLL